MEMSIKRLAGAIALAITASQANATPVYHPPGPNLTYGDVSNGQTIMSDITNPAAGAAALKKNGNQYRFGLLSSVGVGAEFGEVDDLYNEIEAQADAYSAGVNLDFSDTSQIGGLVNEQRDVINGILVKVQDKGYAKAFVSAHLPVMPLVVAHKALGGSIVLDINGSVASKVYGLHDTIDVDGAVLQSEIETDIANSTLQPSYSNGDVTITYDPFDAANSSLTVDNDSSVVAKAAYTAELALGYSRSVMNTETGNLYAGLRGRYYKVGLTRKAIRMSNINDVEQELENISDEDLNESTAIGVDAGVLWVDEHFRVGATLTNINEPSFEYPAFDPTGFDIAGPVATTLAKDDTYTMESQLKLEAAAYSASQNWVLSAAVDANPVMDPMGDEYQWATASAAYATDSWLIPGFRVGYRKNLAGSELSYATAGFTLFKVVNLDVAYGLESVTIDGETVPRSLMANLGLEVTF